MFLRKLKYNHPNLLYATQSIFPHTNLTSFTIPTSHITSAFHQTRGVPSKLTIPLPSWHPWYPWQSFSILVRARDPAKLSEQLQTALDEHRIDKAWTLHEQHMNMEGFPRKPIVNKLITTFAQSLSVLYLERAYDLVTKAVNEHKQCLLEKESVMYLALCLAKCGLPVNAASVLRNLVEMESFPAVNALAAVLGHMAQTAAGAYLAAELVLEFGFMFRDGRVDPRKKSNELLIGMKPNTVLVNIALAGCLVFGKSRKAEEVLDMVPRIGVKTDVTMLVLMGHVYERNGRREEIKKLKRYVDEACELTDDQFRQFYNCLLSCCLKFGDLESAENMVVEMVRKAKKARNSLGVCTFMVDQALTFTEEKSNQAMSLSDEKSNQTLKLSDEKSNKVVTYEDFCGDRKFVKLEIEAKELLKTMVMKFEAGLELIVTERGILQPTETMFVKLVKAYLECNKVKELVGFLVKVEKEESPVSPDSSPLIQVIETCVSLGWLDHAHDVLDEARLRGVKTGSSVYSLLLKAYCKENRSTEVNSLLKDARKAGIQLDASSYEAVIEARVVGKDTNGALNLFKEMKEGKLDKSGQREFDSLVNECVQGEAKFMGKLLNEIKDGQRVDCGLHDWNNVIHFFCRKRLMQDAEKALKKMRSLGHAPNAQTFHSLVTGYAAVGGKYTEVTELWGEMKVLGLYHGMKFDQELLDSVLYTFVRGGFFIRANEVVEMMERGKMFVDKYKYRTLFLKYHKAFCKGKAPKVQTESQLNRREAALTFKKWVGLF